MCGVVAPVGEGGLHGEGRVSLPATFKLRFGIKVESLTGHLLAPPAETV